MGITTPSFLALSFDFDTLLPILFFVLYGLSQFLGGKKKQTELPEDEKENDALQEARERAREIREEIQRKISERQTARRNQGNGDWESPPIVLPPDPLEEHPVLEETETVLERTLTPKSSLEEPAKEYQTSLQGELERRLEEQKKRLAEAKKKNEQARQEANRRRQEAMAKSLHLRRNRAANAAKVSLPSAVASKGAFRDQLIAGLRDPIAVRQAILYREILDPPVGLR